MADNTTTQLTPVFIIYLNDQRISVDMESDVKDIRVEKNIDQSSIFAITLSDMERKWTDHPDFIEGTKVKIMLGYKDAVAEVITGRIIGMKPMFKKNTGVRVTIKGCDIMHQLHRGKKTVTFANMTDKEIVEKISTGAGVAVDCEEIGKAKTFTAQTNQTDYEYLLEIGRRYNCRLVIKNDKLMFRPIEDNSTEEVIVEWGKTLMEFHPDMDSRRIVTDVEALGWDNIKKSAIDGIAGYGDIKKTIGQGNTGGATVLDNYGNTKIVLLDDTIDDLNSAEKKAIETITKNSMGYIKAKATVQGNNKIDAGMIVNIKEIGKKLSGEYFVTEVEHLFITEWGYTTNFRCVRNAASG